MLKKLFILWAIFSFISPLASANQTTALLGDWELVNTYCEDRSKMFVPGLGIGRTFTQDGKMYMDMGNTYPGCEITVEMNYWLDGDWIAADSPQVTSPNCSDVAALFNKMLVSRVPEAGFRTGFQMNEDDSRLMIFNPEPNCGDSRGVEEYVRASE